MKLRRETQTLIQLYRIYAYQPYAFHNEQASNSPIHKAASLTLPGCSMTLPGIILENFLSREWGRWLEQSLRSFQLLTEYRYKCQGKGLNMSRGPGVRVGHSLLMSKSPYIITR